MQFWRVVRYLVILTVPTVTNSKKDPCLYAEEFPDIYLGSRNEKCPTPHTGIQQCDYSLPDDRWYKISNASLLNRPPTGDCGVVYPVWMNGTFPSVSEDIVDRTACIKYSASDTCRDQLQIQLKNCSSHIVYNLTSPAYCSVVYCFVSDLPCVEPTTTTTSTMTTSTTTPTPGPTTHQSVSKSTGDATDRTPTNENTVVYVVIIIAGCVVGVVLLFSGVVIGLLIHHKHRLRSRIDPSDKSKPAPGAPPPTPPPPYSNFETLVSKT